MAQIFEEKLSKLSIEETQAEQAMAVISLPKQKVNNYKFGFWIPTNRYADERFDILPLNGLLNTFTMLVKSKECGNCGKMILPKPSKNMALPESCPYCKYDSRKTQRVEKREDIKRSSTFQKLDSLLTEAMKNYMNHANFERKPDYSENWHHEENHETYMKYGIIKEALEIKTLIASLIKYDGFSIRYFTKGDKTYIDLFNEIMENDSILKLEPYYTLLSMATSIIKAPQLKISPQIRGSRMTPANVTNMPNGNPQQQLRK